MLGFGKKPPIDPVKQAEMMEAQEVSTAFQKGITALRDFIAPSSLEFNSTHFRIGTRFARTYYVYGYPRQVYTGWLSGMVNLDEVIDLSMVIQPVDSQIVLNNLRKKVSQLQAGICPAGHSDQPDRCSDRLCRKCFLLRPLLHPSYRRCPGDDQNERGGAPHDQLIPGTAVCQR